MRGLSKGKVLGGGRVIPRLSELTQTRSSRSGEARRVLANRPESRSPQTADAGSIISRGLRPAQKKWVDSLTTVRHVWVAHYSSAGASSRPVDYSGRRQGIDSK